jgi:hypothetical protein
MHYIDPRQIDLFDTTEEQMLWVESKRLYLLGHKGAHPSAEFLWQTEAEERTGFVIGPRYVAKASRGTLFWGVEATFQLLAELTRTEPIDEGVEIEMSGVVAEHTRLFNQYRAVAEQDANEIEQAVTESG